ncbi:MAG: phospho-N-acetylmuramoyl-pentapeptide-transferase [Chitinophagales bacterium]
MLFYLFDYINLNYDFPGVGLFQYISFRAALAIITSLLISLIFGGKIIDMLRKMQVGESVRDLGLKGQMEKQGTPTMGGLLILAAVLIPTLLFAKLDNIYILLMILVTVWMGAIGFLDDYIKVFKKNKKGLAGKFKVIGQIGLGLIVGTTLFFHDDVVVRENISKSEIKQNIEEVELESVIDEQGNTYFVVDAKKPVTTIPFFKNHEFDYSVLLSFLGEGYQKWAFLIFIPIVIFIVTAVSNGANLTDGIDGLATGTSAIIGATLGVFAYVSGNIIFSDYLNVMYIPMTGELVIYSAAFIGACIGFLWYNAYPAQVFMGDTGSLAIGGIIAALAIILRKELLIPLLCGIFLVENLSVMMQVGYFKFTKSKNGEGVRLFKMAPLHHHYQKLGFHESKIVSRFWIVGILLAVLTIVTLKIR